MNNRYIIDQAEFVLLETVNKFDLGSNESGMDDVELNHLYTALKKEELVRDNVSKDVVLDAIFKSVSGAVGSYGMIDRNSIKDMIEMLDECGILVLE